MKQMSTYLLNNTIMLILVFLLTMISVAFFTLFERKILSYMHYRKGPNKVSFWGMTQPFNDAMKLLTKEFFFTKKSNYWLYIFSPFIMFFISLSMWLIYPFYTNLWNWNFNCLFFLCIMSLGVYGLMISGWSSNSMFAFLGSIRSIAQSISYEIIFSLALLIPFMLINSINFYNLNMYNMFFLTFWPSMMILFMSMLAEINRTPFDLSEGESELVSGFNIEYSSHSFTLIFLAEYTSILFMMFLFSMMNFNSKFKFLLFLWTIILTYFVIWIRATLPRIRYDFLMIFCWMYLLPYILYLFLIYLISFKMLIKFLIL